MRLNKKNKKKVIVAVILGIIVTFMLFGSMNGKNAANQEMMRKIQEQQAALEQLKKNPFVEQKPEEKKISAVIAACDIKVGDTYLEEMLKTQEYLEEELPEGYFKNPAMLVGKKAGKNIVKGQFITTSEIQSDDIASIEIPNDMRAISIPVEKFKGLASHIRVGSSVDLLNASNPPEFIAQNIRIVAFEASGATSSSRYSANAGDRINFQYLSATQANAITFLIPIDLVPKVIEAISSGQLQIITRNNSDEKVIITESELPPPPDEEISLPNGPAEEVALEPPSLPEPDPAVVTLIEGINPRIIDEFIFNENVPINEEEKPSSLSENTEEFKKLLDMVE